MNINKRISRYNHYNGRGEQEIQYIVIHYVGALGGAEDNCNYYAGGNRGASAHYYVGFNGEVWQSVEDQNGAWSVGGGLQGSGGSAFYQKCNNYNSLNIEMCVRKSNTATMNATDRDWYFEDATVKSTVELTKVLMKKYTIPASRVIRHYDVVGKICPNPYVYNTTKHTWTTFKASLGASQPNDQESNNVNGEGKELFHVQAGAFKDKKLADCLSRVLKDKGFDVFVKKVGEDYKVQVGAYSMKSNAKSELQRLQREGYEGFIYND